MRLDEALRAMLPAELYRQPPATRLEHDFSKVLQPRRRGDCASLGACKDAWIDRWGELQAACPAACVAYARPLKNLAAPSGRDSLGARGHHAA